MIMGAQCDREIHTEHGGQPDETPRWGVASMRGWRPTMEDYHTAHVDFQPGISLYGVFDGHSGKHVAEHCAKSLLRHIVDDAVLSPI